jgi:hypothetical protein
VRVLGAGTRGEWYAVVISFGGGIWKWLDFLCAAVTLKGTVIHKSGLITGGRSTHGEGRSGRRRTCKVTRPSSVSIPLSPISL